MFFFFFVYLVSLTYLFHDSSYIKRQTLSGCGHKFSEFARSQIGTLTKSKDPDEMPQNCTGFIFCTFHADVRH